MGSQMMKYEVTAMATRGVTTCALKSVEVQELDAILEHPDILDILYWAKNHQIAFSLVAYPKQ